MAIGKRPSVGNKGINLDSPEVQNFINHGATLPVKEQEPVIEKVPEETKTAVEEVEKSAAKRGRKSGAESGKVKYYNLPIPEEVFDGIEDYIYKNRKEKKITIRGFIIDCIKKELGKENIL